MADISVAALHNIRRMEVLELSGIKDPKTSAYTFAYFADLAGREIEMSRRHDRRFSVATLSIDNFEMLAAQLEPHELSVMTSRIVEVALDTIRDSDVLGARRGRRVLPAPAGHWQPGRPHLQAAHDRGSRPRRAPGGGGRARSFGPVHRRGQLPGGRARSVAPDAREPERQARSPALAARAAAAHGRPFWTTFDALVGDGSGYRTDDGGLLLLDRRLARMDDADGSLAHVLLPRPPPRASPTSSCARWGCAGRPRASSTCTPASCQARADQAAVEVSRERHEICVLRPAGPWPAAPHGATEIRMEDPLLDDTRFLLFLGETEWYGYLGRVIGASASPGSTSRISRSWTRW